LSAYLARHVINNKRQGSRSSLSTHDMTVRDEHFVIQQSQNSYKTVDKRNFNYILLLLILRRITYRRQFSNNSKKTTNKHEKREKL